MKNIQAVGDLENPDVAQLDKILKARGIAPVWNSEAVGDAKVVLLCVTTNFNRDAWTPIQRLALRKCRNKKILMVLFNNGVGPAILADLKAVDFGANRPGAIDELIKAINHFII